MKVSSNLFCCERDEDKESVFIYFIEEMISDFFIDLVAVRLFIGLYCV